MRNRNAPAFRKPFRAVPLRRQQARSRFGDLGMFRSGVVLAALAGAAIGIASTNPSASQAVAIDDRGDPVGCRAVDGDTLRCGAERIRLVGIDTPELPGHCRAGRTCVEGDAAAATRSLTRAIDGPLTVTRTGEDRYGRTLATIRGPLGDVSCHQLRFTDARYRRDWDDGDRVRRACPSLTGG